VPLESSGSIRQRSVDEARQARDATRVRSKEDTLLGSWVCVATAAQIPRLTADELRRIRAIRSAWAWQCGAR